MRNRWVLIGATILSLLIGGIGGISLDEKNFVGMLGLILPIYMLYLTGKMKKVEDYPYKGTLKAVRGVLILFFILLLVIFSMDFIVMGLISLL